MCGSLTLYQRRFYSSNAQYLPFYVIDGERDGGNPKQMADLFKEWTRSTLHLRCMWNIAAEAPNGSAREYCRT